MPSSPYILGTQQWSALQHHLTEPGHHWPHLDAVLAAYAAAGCQAWEGGADDDTQAATLRAALPRHGLTAPSAYVGGRLHEADWAAQLPGMLAAARRAHGLGARIIVCNPDPIRWHGPENKNDEQLRHQSAAMQAFGVALQAEGMRLAYHWHGPEFRCGGREVAHVLTRTDPAVVGVCFDTHWAYAGLGDSNQGMFDLLESIFPRVVSFHVRQVRAGVYNRVFGEGDIDYGAWARLLRAKNWQGPIILEQCRNDELPPVEDFLGAQQASLRALRTLLGA